MSKESKHDSRTQRSKSASPVGDRHRQSVQQASKNLYAALSLTDCVTLASATTTFCLEEFKFARRGDFALPAPLVWVVYAHVPFRKFYPALRISARFLKRHSAPGFASLMRRQ